MTQMLSEEKELVKEITRRQRTGELTKAVLRTDDRVLARVTDGIYRQPASALRELISNAYDADATKVIIQTDAPRFDQISVRDDGNGMNIASLVRLIHHIGGSAKRRRDGIATGVVCKRDPLLSPHGRRLIGKIGIGLFSVSQLTRHFKIVTKVKGQDYRLMAEVILRTYAEDADSGGGKSGDKVETGTVSIVSAHADDKDSHGTEIILMDLRPQAKKHLQSQEMWDGPIKPQFHIGRFNNTTGDISIDAALPWNNDSPPRGRFLQLFQGIVDTVGTDQPNPQIKNVLDNYLQSLWTLSLAAPVDYINGHPFDRTTASEPQLYSLAPRERGTAKPMQLADDEKIRQHLGLKAPERGNQAPFRVFIDDVELLRPIRFTGLPETSQAIKHPMLFIGSASPDLTKISDEERGGDLAFEAYFLWAPKIVPKDNNGLLIRIGDASGSLFDPSFAKYQVSELTRLKQITAEVFVLKGLDAALNIDRESFNESHPHYQYIQRWVHGALRQITNTIKQRAKELHSEDAERIGASNAAELEKVVVREIAAASDAEDRRPADIEIADADIKQIQEMRNKGRVALDARNIFTASAMKRHGAKAKKNDILFRKKIKAVAQVLDAYGLLDGLTYNQQEKLLRAIAEVFSVEEGNGR